MMNYVFKSREITRKKIMKITVCKIFDEKLVEIKMINFEKYL